MTDVFVACWSFFSKYTDIWDRFSYVGDYKKQILSVVFGLALAVGFYIYRLYFCATFFYLYVTLCTLVLPRFISWPRVVAFFSVSGVMLTFLIYKSARFGGAVICGVIAGMIGYMIMGILLFLYFPVHTVCLLMAMFGGLGLSSLYGYPDYMGAAVGAVFTIIQLLLTRKQTLFEKRYPARVQYMIDQKKRASA